MVKTPFEAGGLAFSSEKMMEKAVKEGEGIRYIKNSVDMSDPQMVFDVYCQMVSQRLFETPPGYVYLYELRELLRANPSISNRDIPPIPVIASEKADVKRPAEAQRRQQPAQKKVKNVKNIDYKPWFKASISISVILLLIVIGMFAVTATSGNINIVNYENALIEKYEGWETKLKEREEKIREREKMFGQSEFSEGEAAD